MAADKNSFVLYTDKIHLVRKLVESDRKNGTNNAGELLLHIFEYVCDKEPEPVNFTVDIAFEPIKQNLKKDLKKWQGKQEQRAEAGRLGGLARAEKAKQKQANQATATNFKQKQANQAVTVTGTVTEINSINTIYTKKDFLSDWNELRTKHLKKPSHLNTLNAEETEHLANLSKDYNRESIRSALIGLFKQKKMPNDNQIMQSNPKHFLTHFNGYLTAYHDQNENLYGKKQLETTL